MKNKRLLYGILIVCALTIAGSGLFIYLKKPATVQKETKTYTDPGKLIKIQKGGKFQIALDSNPTTGYGWEFNTDENFISLVEQKFESTSELIGAGGIETFEFSTLNTGETEITFLYKRPWEEKVAEKKVFKVKIE